MENQTWLKAMGVLVLVGLSGCYYHRAYLEDQRIEGVNSWYQGNSDPLTLAYARQVMIKVDRQDQLWGELVNPQTAEERRQQIRQDLEWLEKSYQPVDQVVLAAGVVSNETKRQAKVEIYQLPSQQLVASFDLAGWNKKTLSLPIGYRYQFCFSDEETAEKWSYFNRAAISLTPPWECRLQSCFPATSF